MAALFRYADVPADGELWIDFHHLQAVIDKLVQAFEQYIEQKEGVERAKRYGSPERRPLENLE